MLLEKVINLRDKIPVITNIGQEKLELDTNKYIDGSDVPIILGLSVFTKPNKLAKLKNNLLEYDNKKNIYTEIKSIFQPLIRDITNQKYNINTVPCCKIIEELALRANSDGYDNKNNIILEIKTNNGKQIDKVEYMTQIQFYMTLFNVKKCILVEYKTTFKEEEIIDVLLKKEATKEELNKIARSLFDKERIIFTEIESNPKMEVEIFKYIENFKNIDLEMAKRNNNFEIMAKIYGKIETITDRIRVDEILNSMKELDRLYKEKNIVKGIEETIKHFINQEHISKKIKNREEFKYKPQRELTNFNEDLFKIENKEIYDEYSFEKEIKIEAGTKTKKIRYIPFSEKSNQELEKIEEKIEYLKNKESFTDDDIDNICSLNQNLLNEKEIIENETIKQIENFVDLIKKYGFENLPHIETKNFYYVKESKVYQKKLNKRLLEFENPELLDKYTTVEILKEEIEFKK